MQFCHGTTSRQCQRFIDISPSRTTATSTRTQHDGQIRCACLDGCAYNGKSSHHKSEGAAGGHASHVSQKNPSSRPDTTRRSILIKKNCVVQSTVLTLHTCCKPFQSQHVIYSASTHSARRTSRPTARQSKASFVCHYHVRERTRASTPDMVALSLLSNIF